MPESGIYHATSSCDGPIQHVENACTAREETHETPDTTAQKTLTVAAIVRLRQTSSQEELQPQSSGENKRRRQARHISPHRQVQTWLPRFFRNHHGESYAKRFRNSVAILVQNTERFHINALKGGKKRAVDAALHYDLNGARCLEISSPGWAPIEQYIPDTVPNVTFTEFVKRERLASVCSYHDIKTKKEYFHCLWQVENPANSEFFRKPPRRIRQHTNGVYNDITVLGPIFDGAAGTTWQAIAYPFGYRSNSREGLVGMAVRYNTGPETQISAGFQISLLDPAKMNYRGLQEMVKDHCTKLQETSKRSNLFKRGKKGREQTQFRHRFSKEVSGAEMTVSSHMRRLWNNGNPAGRIRMEAKNGKIFRVHSTVLQLNGGVLGHLAANLPSDSPKVSLKFPDLTEAVLKKLLEYCYTLQVSAIHKTPFELLLAAHRYDLQGLQDLAEKDVARYIDLDNVLDLYVWNDSIQSQFLASFISLFFTVNYVHIRQLPEFEEKLTWEQQTAVEQKYKPAGLGAGELSEGGESYLSEDNDGEEDGDSGLENDDVFDVTAYDDRHENGSNQGLFLSVNADHSFDQEEANQAELGEEPEEFQMDQMNPEQVNVIINQAEMDQAAVIAQIFGDLEGLDPDALDFLVMLM